MPVTVSSPVIMPGALQMCVWYVALSLHPMATSWALLFLSPSSMDTPLQSAHQRLLMPLDLGAECLQVGCGEPSHAIKPHKTQTPDFHKPQRWPQRELAVRLGMQTTCRLLRVGHVART